MIDKPLVMSKSSLFLFLMVVGFQTTDVTIFSIKLWEVLAFFLVFFAFYEKKLFKVSLAFLFLLIFSSLFVPFFLSDHFYSYGFLKSKYILTLVRGVEIFLCFSIFFLILEMKHLRPDWSREYLIEKFLFYNFIASFLILILYFLSRFSHIDLFVLYDGGRLRGFFVEGGPYGLYCAFLSLLCLYVKNRLMFLFFVFNVYLSISKAGYICVFLGSIIYLFCQSKFLIRLIQPNRFRFFLGISFFIFFLGIFIYFVAYNYVELYFNYKHYLASHVDDNSFVYGRVAASQIGPNIFIRNPFFGVGLGNYSLVRNNSYYRGDFPEVSGWDLTGLGGVLNLIIENGIFGFLLFYLFLIKVFFDKRVEKDNIYFFYIFLLPFVLGVQLYFPYPWAIIGFLRFPRRYKNE